ncbi:alpha/beta hydrolase [Leptospira ilyithenensis]|uniref:Alpha/beta fold hydrolase n=1 Tax=Leptospira ilyithenensis TaxID=2484901 RepID=A0A4V3JXE1_9LEPT|nr:alpha/beta fold hydrolase [Leptospira ilyithenensis]TGN13756.1 alpha/beta fold hydrolase [Leptospira ilyithenensis]
MKIFGKWITAILLILTSFLTTTYFLNQPNYNFQPESANLPFDSYFQKELEASKNEGTKEGNEERLIRFSEEKTPIGILYIHGFGASRAEGEEVMDKVADYFQANTYYVRLPGHGTNVEDHLNTPFQSYLQDAETALLESTQLGEKLVLVGTSMGGLISSYLAAKYPDKIAAVILASPFYNFSDPSANLYKFTWGSTFVDLVLGKIRKSAELDPKDQSYKFWYKNQYYGAVQNLMNLKRFIDQENPLSRIEEPVLVFYYYKSEEEQDRSASVSAMVSGFEKIQSGPKANPLNKIVKVEKGAHVLLSKYSETDKPLLFQEITEFITKTTGAVQAKPNNSKKAKR